MEMQQLLNNLYMDFCEIDRYSYYSFQLHIHSDAQVKQIYELQKDDKYHMTGTFSIKIINRAGRVFNVIITVIIYFYEYPAIVCK